MDLIVRHVRLRDRDYALADIGVTDGRITAVGPDLPASAEVEIDGEAGMALPPFVDSHSHFDKSMMIYRSPPPTSGTMRESLARSYEAKRESSVEDVVARGAQALQWAIANGTGAIRAHSDVDFAWGITGVQGLLELKARFADVIDLQVLVLPAENPMDDRLKELVRQGMDAGADLIGGSPGLEDTPDDVAAYVDFVFEMAEEYETDIDLHVDQIVDQASSTRSAEYILTKTLRDGWAGRVSVNHWGALSTYSRSDAARLVGLAHEAAVNFCTCPKEELMISGMGPSRIKELLAAGVNCGYGHNNNADTFSPYGRMDMLEAGLLTLHLGEFNRMADAETVLDMGTVNPARTMKLEGYGLTEGCRADINVVDAPSAYEMFRRQAGRRYVIRRGRVVAETRTDTRLHLDVPGVDKERPGT